MQRGIILLITFLTKQNKHYTLGFKHVIMRKYICLREFSNTYVNILNTVYQTENKSLKCTTKILTSNSFKYNFYCITCPSTKLFNCYRKEKVFLSRFILTKHFFSFIIKRCYEMYQIIRPRNLQYSFIVHS